MDREVLIEKLLYATESKREELEKMSDSDLMGYYMYLEDSGVVCGYDD